MGLVVSGIVNAATSTGNVNVSGVFQPTCYWSSPNYNVNMSYSAFSTYQTTANLSLMCDLGLSYNISIDKNYVNAFGSNKKNLGLLRFYNDAGYATLLKSYTTGTGANISGVGTGNYEPINIYIHAGESNYSGTYSMTRTIRVDY